MELQCKETVKEEVISTTKTIEAITIEVEEEEEEVAEEDTIKEEVTLPTRTKIKVACPGKIHTTTNSVIIISTTSKDLVE